MRDVTSRRAFMLNATTGLVAAATAMTMAGCTTSSTTTNPVTLVNEAADDAELIADAVSAASTYVGQIQGVSATTISAINADAAKVTSIAQTIEAATSTPATSVLQSLESAVTTYAPVVLALIPGGSNYVNVVDAVVDLASTLVASAGGTPSTASVRMSANRPRYTRDQARRVLEPYRKQRS